MVPWDICALPMGDDEKREPVLEVAELSDVGVVREHNEDAFYVDPDHRFFVVADGMGGHAAGEVASALAVETVAEGLAKATDEITGFISDPTDSKRKALIELLEETVRDAHRRVFETGAQESDKQGMGTTLDVLLIAGAEGFIGHVGDSRTYLFRQGTATQLTTDHTVAEVLMIEGKLTPEEAAASPLRTILVNAIGVAPEVGVELAHITLESGDRIMLCSDGLHDYFPVEEELAEKTKPGQEIDEALAQLIELAKERGGHDNITGVLIEVVSAPEISGKIDPFATTLTGGAVPEEIERDNTLRASTGDREEEEDDNPEEADTAESELQDLEVADEAEGRDAGSAGADAKKKSGGADRQAARKDANDLKQTVPLGPKLKKRDTKSPGKKKP